MFTEASIFVLEYEKQLYGLLLNETSFWLFIIIREHTVVLDNLIFKIVHYGQNGFLANAEIQINLITGWTDLKRNYWMMLR